MSPLLRRRGVLVAAGAAGPTDAVMFSAYAAGPSTFTAATVNDEIISVAFTLPEAMDLHIWLTAEAEVTSVNWHQLHFIGSLDAVDVDSWGGTYENKSSPILEDIVGYTFHSVVEGAAAGAHTVAWRVYNGGSGIDITVIQRRVTVLAVVPG